MNIEVGHILLAFIFTLFFIKVLKLILPSNLKSFSSEVKTPKKKATKKATKQATKKATKQATKKATKKSTKQNIKKTK